MPFKREFSDEGEWLRVITTGYIDTPEEFVRKILMGVDRMAEHKNKRILVDDRGLEVRVDNLDVTMGATKLEKTGIPALGLRAACICRPEDMKIYKMIETVYRNRSINYYVFESEQEAIDWLRS